MLSAATITGVEVCSMQDEKRDTIQDVMLDVSEGKIRYAVLAVGAFWGWVIACSLFRAKP